MLCIKQIACGLTLTWDVLKYFKADYSTEMEN